MYSTLGYFPFGFVIEACSRSDQGMQNIQFDRDSFCVRLFGSYLIHGLKQSFN